MRRLNQTFVTPPFDRDDIYGLASALDDCMDAMEEAGDLIVLYKVDELPPAGLRAGAGAAALRRAHRRGHAPRLRSMDQLSDYWIEINRLENQGDKLHRELIAELFDDTTDGAAHEAQGDRRHARGGRRRFERVANMVETIALKES